MKLIAKCSWLIPVLAIVLAAGPAWAAVSGAGFTTFADPTNPANAGIPTDGCHNSPNGIDCNNYSAKEDVYMSGGPSGGSGLSDGTYYFTVIVPGHQNGGFIQGAVGNLSDNLTPSGATAGDNASGDAIACRTFSPSAAGRSIRATR